MKPFNIAPVKATVLNANQPVEVDIRFSPADYSVQKAYLNLVGLPVNELFYTLLVIKLEFDRNPEECITFSVPQDGDSGWSVKP